MDSENSSAIEASPIPYNNGAAAAVVTVKDEIESNGVTNADPASSSPDPDAEANGFVEKVEELPASDSDPTLEPAQVASTNGPPTADDGSGWTGASKEGNDSGWISADGAPVVLPPANVSVPKQRHTFYLVRIPRSVDEKLRNEIRLAEAKLDQTVNKRDQYKLALQAKRKEKNDLLEKLKPIRERDRACKDALGGKFQEMKPMHDTLNQYKNLRGKGGVGLCSSEEELNDRIAELEYRIQHESIPLKEEKQLLREIKQLESTRSQVCANIVLQAQLMENRGPKEDVQDQLKFLSQDVDSIKKEQQQTRAEYDSIDRELQKLNAAIEELRQLHEKANNAQQEAFATVRELKKQENAKNNMFYQSRRDLQEVKELCTSKDFKGLRDFCSTNMENFMNIWNTDDKFRAEYVKSNERSTVRRLETLDGRSLGPGEKPPQIIDDFAVQPSKDAKAVTAPPSSDGNSKASKPVNQVLKVVETKEASREKNPVKEKKEEKIEENDVFIPVMTQKSRQIDVVKDPIDSAEVKEQIRQEQIAKAKEAEERKKKRAEKAELKAQARAQKEAERKEKEREKKAQKKSSLVTGATSSVTETEASSEETLPVVEEPAEVKTEESSKKSSTSSSTTNKAQKGTVINRRKAAVKAPKPKLPSKKSSSLPLPLWALGLIAAALVLLAVLVLFMRQ